MADQELSVLVFAAQYGDVEDAINDFVAIKALHHQKWIGAYESALFEKTTDGKTHIINTDSSVRAWGATAGLVVGGILGVIFPPSVLVMGAAGAGIGALAGHFAGGLPRSVIKELADTLQAGQAGIVLVGEFTPEAAVEKLLTHAAKITRAQINETAEELKKAVDDAVKS